MVKASHLIKIWFYDSFPENYTEKMVYAAIMERFQRMLGDKLEKVEVLAQADKPR